MDVNGKQSRGVGELVLYEGRVMRPNDMKQPVNLNIILLFSYTIKRC